MSDDVTAALANARALYARGLSVIAIPPPRPGVPVGNPGDGKVPAIAWRRFQTERASMSEIEAMFADAPMNVAVITGRLSGVVVIDADTPEAIEWCTRRRHLPYTPWQTQTARGFHLWYAHPGVHVPNRARLDTGEGRLAIDVRGDGGYVIAPGSQHATGVIYRYAGDWTRTRDALPRFWPGWLHSTERRSLPPERMRPIPAGPLIDRARRYLAAVPVPEIGAGSDVATFTQACRLVRGFGLTPIDAEVLLWEWAGNRHGWTRAWIADKVASAERYGTEPIGGLQ